MWRQKKRKKTAIESFWKISCLFSLHTHIHIHVHACCVENMLESLTLQRQDESNLAKYFKISEEKQKELLNIRRCQQLIHSCFLRVNTSRTYLSRWIWQLFLVLSYSSCFVLFRVQLNKVLRGLFIKSLHWSLNQSQV